MTVATTTNKALFNGSGSTGPFTFNFKFWDNSEIYCTKTVSGVDTVLTEGVHYTLTGAGIETGGSITLITALPVGENLTIVRTLPFVQDTDLPNNGPFFAQTIEDTFDKLEMQIQQLAEVYDRSLKLSVSNRHTGSLELIESDVADKILSFDEDGNLAVINSSYSIVVKDGSSAGTATVVYADASSGVTTVNLPASGEVVVIKADNTNNSVLILGIGSSTVLYGATCELTVKGESIRLLYSVDTDNWDAI